MEQEHGQGAREGAGGQGEGGGLGEQALAYAAAGWRIHPLHGISLSGGCTCGKPDCGKAGKHPRVAGWTSAASADPVTVRDWWGKWPDANIGLVTGTEPGLVVIDVDGPAGTASLAALETEYEPLPETRRIRTGRGEHVCFDPQGLDVRNSSGLLGAGIDVRGNGGYVVAPPSIHASGVRYEFVATDDEGGVPDVAPLPDWLARLLSYVAPEPEPAGTGDPIPEGRRNSELARIGGGMRKGGMGEQELRYALREANASRCIPPLDEDEVDGIAASVARYPVGVPAPLAKRPAKFAKRPALHLPLGDLHVVTSAILDSLRSSNDPPHIFQRGRALVVVVRDNDEQPETTPKVAPLDAKGLRVHVGQRFAMTKPDWDSRGKAVKEACNLTTDQADYLLRLGAWGLPALRGVVCHPFVTKGGRLVTAEGYDPESGILVDLGGLRLPPVPQVPTDADMRRAKALLMDDLIGDFPFADEASRAHAVSVPITTVVRELIRQPVPGVAFTAADNGIGKSLLAISLGVIPTGIETPKTAEAPNDAEWKKLLTAIGRDTPELILFDNIGERLDSASLAGFLTSAVWQDRVLSTSETITFPVRAVVLFTGRGVQATKEVARRLVFSRLDARMEDPSGRTGFRHENLVEWAKANRADLLWACLVLVQNWLAAGRPKGRGRKGGYEEWAAVVGGILDAAGIPGLLDNEKDRSAFIDAETMHWEALVEVWWEALQGKDATAGQIFAAAEAADVLTTMIDGSTEHARKAKLGRAISQHIGQILCGKRICAGKRDGKKDVSRYRLELVPEQG